MNIYKLLAFVLSGILLSGCTSIGTHIISNPSIYLSDSRLSGIDLERFDTEKREHCISGKSLCIKYLYAKAYKREHFSAGASVNYTIDASGNGVTNNFTYRAPAESFNQIKGTAVLFHGFGASKEAMLVTSVYFRALGMDVIAFDLFGHGESNQDFAFGAKEHELYIKLLNEINLTQALSKPVIAVGHSMGALTAANIALESEVIDGSILLAPMIQFNDAAKFYLAYKSPMLSNLFSTHMDEIVSRAMKYKNTTPFETDISLIMKDTQKQALIINSDIDSVSPIKYFEHLKSDFIHTEVFEGRSHPSLIAFDNEDAKSVKSWLIKNFAVEPIDRP